MNFLTAKWINLVMANYEISPEILQPYIPGGTALYFYHGRTFVSLVGFMFLDTKIFGIPIPGFGSFEEINLRFYVIRKDKNQIKRGVVFINETVPFRQVAWIANKLYKEHYTSIPTRHEWLITESKKIINYYWMMNKNWNHLQTSTSTGSDPILLGSIEEFIFEHYWGYTGAYNSDTTEYEVFHPSWNVNKVETYSIDCDFVSMYGRDFEILSHQKPSTVLVAEGSPISVKWKRTKIT